MGWRVWGTREPGPHCPLPVICGLKPAPAITGLLSPEQELRAAAPDDGGGGIFTASWSQKDGTKFCFLPMHSGDSFLSTDWLFMATSSESSPAASLTLLPSLLLPPSFPPHHSPLPTLPCPFLPGLD
ncbi:unnamed protein product [Caretta caretta]